MRQLLTCDGAGSLIPDALMSLPKNNPSVALTWYILADVASLPTWQHSTVQGPSFHILWPLLSRYCERVLSVASADVALCDGAGSFIPDSLASPHEYNLSLMLTWGHFLSAPTTFDVEHLR